MTTNSTDSQFQYELFKPNTARTCREYCRGKDYIYAVYYKATENCLCLNDTQPNDAISRSSTKCWTKSPPAHYGYVYTLGKHI